VAISRDWSSGCLGVNSLNARRLMLARSFTTVDFSCTMRCVTLDSRHQRHVSLILSPDCGIPAKVPGVMPEDKPGAGWSDEFDMSVMKH
jgi:hypothetical protein